MAGYIGNIPVPQGTQTRQNFTATASQTSFPTIGYTAGFIDVYLNGVKLINGTDFTATNGSDVVLAVGASASDVLNVVIFDTFTALNQTFTDSISVEGDGTFDTAVVTVENTTKENTDGGRESRVRFRGFKSGDVSPHTLAEIQGSHDSTGADQKGDLIFKTNDGSDNAAPTEALRIGSDQRLFMTRGDTLAEISMDANRSGASQSIGRFNYFWNGTQVAKIEALAGSDTTNKDDGELRFQTRESGSALAERWRITKEGHFKAMSNGLGIDFSATEGSGASSSILDDYEEGTFTPTYGGSSSDPSGVTYDPTVGNEGVYVKVGSAVFVQINIRTDAISNVGSGNLKIRGLPYATAALSGNGGVASLAIGQVADFAGEAPIHCYVDEGLTTIQLFFRSSVTGTSSASQCSDLATGTNDNLIRISGTYYSTA